MCGRFLCLKGIQQVQCKKVKSFSDRQYSFFLKYRIFISTIKSNPLIVLNKGEKSLLPYPKKDQFIWNDIG